MKLSVVGLLLAVLLPVSAVCAQQSDHDKEQIRQGKIHRVTIVTSFGSVELRNVMEFDPRGNLIATVGYGTSGTPLVRWAYTYDADNRMVKQTSVDFRGSSDTWTYSYTLNLTGQATSAQVKDANGIVTARHTYRLDAQGNIREDAAYGKDGQFVGKSEYEYDSAGNRVGSFETSRDGSLIKKASYTYKDKDAVSQALLYDSSGQLSAKILYTYDSSDHLLQKIEYRADGSISLRNTYARDAQGFVVEDTESDGKGNITRTTSSYEFYR